MINPFKPGAGHQPPYLAGRDKETGEFKELLNQSVILQNVILTGLRGIGKTVLLESFKPLANEKRWLWAGTDCSESASVNEDKMALRLITDIALITSNIKINSTAIAKIGFDLGNTNENIDTFLNFEFIVRLYNLTPGLVSDKLKGVLEFVWSCIHNQNIAGIIFAYDEAQTLSDHAKGKEYPLSLLLDVFQSIQKKGVPFMLVLTGLPTLLTQLVETRTYSERLFRVIVLERLNEYESRDAILKPIEDAKNTQKFNDTSIQIIIKESGGYPYFIQFICKEVFEVFSQQIDNEQVASVPIDAIIQKLDNDFFAGRWAGATDRERELMRIIANQNIDEFSINDVMIASNKSDFKPFSRTQIHQMFIRLIEHGLIYKNRRGSYSFAVPLLEKYILRMRK